MWKNLAFLACAVAAPSAAATLPPLRILAVIADTNSVKIRFAPVKGAVDYRVYDVTNPAITKYAGTWHVFAPWNWHFATTADSPPGAANGDEHVTLPLTLQPGDFTGPGFDTNDPEVANIAPYHAAIPANEIEWNGLTHGVPATLVVEAVDAPGPVPPQNLTNNLNAHAVAGAGTLLPSAAPAMQGMTMTAAASTTADLAFDTAHQSLGADRGATPDGRVSTNGQLSYCAGIAVTAHMNTNHPPPGTQCGDTAPRAIAASAPITVVADAPPALPSGSDATQVFFDSFDAGTFAHRVVTDRVSGRATFRLTTQTALWQLAFTDVDLIASSAFVADHHYMDVIYDGATARRSPVIHNNHAVISLSPQPVADFSAGRILHVTFEVDAEVDGRRWFGVSLAPANAPLTTWYSFNGPVNASNQALFIQVEANTINRDVMSPDPANPHGTPIDTALGAWPDGLRHNPYNGGPPYQDGRGLDNRSRFDVFVSQTRIATYEDGRQISQDRLAQPLPFAQAARIYFPHYLYHTGNEINELIAYRPYQNVWIDDAPYSDERHWNDMGYEVLPATTPWDSLGRRINAGSAASP